MNWSEFGWDSDDDDDDSDGSIDSRADDGFTEDEVIYYLVHRMAQKKQLGFISGKKWTQLSAECRKYLRDMPQEIRAELCASLASEMRGEGGSLEANSAKTSGQEPDKSAESATDDDAPTDGCLMIQEAVREFNKKKKAAAQSKKAGSTRKDAHPGDNRSMMSQNKGGRKEKRSRYMLQRSLSTTVRVSENDTLGPSESLTKRNTGSTLEASQDLFGNVEENPTNLSSPIALIPDRAGQECTTLTVATVTLNRPDDTPGESPNRDPETSESECNQVAHDSRSWGIKDITDAVRKGTAPTSTHRPLRTQYGVGWNVHRVRTLQRVAWEGSRGGSVGQCSSS